MFGLSPIGPSLVPRFCGIETNEPRARESKRRRTRASGSRKPPRERRRRRSWAAGVLPRPGRLSHAGAALAMSEREPPLAVRTMLRRPAEIATDPIAQRAFPVPGARRAASRGGRSSGDVRQASGHRAFENIFAKNNDLRNLRFTAAAEASDDASVEPSDTASPAAPPRLTAQATRNFRISSAERVGPGGSAASQTPLGPRRRFPRIGDGCAAPSVAGQLDGVGRDGLREGSRHVCQRTGDHIQALR